MIQKLVLCCVYCIAATDVYGCASKLTEPPADSPLVIVEGARDVRHTSEHDGVVEYWNMDAYPASVTIERLDQLMSRRDWRTTEEDVLSYESNPDLRSWGSYYEASGERVDEWKGSWKDAKGNFVTYVLRYRVPKGKPIPTRLEVVGIHMTAERVQRMRKAAEKIPKLQYYFRSPDSAEEATISRPFESHRRPTSD